MQFVMLEYIHCMMAFLISFFSRRKPGDDIPVRLIRELIILLGSMKPINNAESFMYFNVQCCLGLVLLSENKFIDAGEVFLYLYNENPTDPVVLFFNAEIALYFGYYEFSNDCILKALEKMPNNGLFLHCQNRIVEKIHADNTLHPNRKLRLKQQIIKLNVQAPTKFQWDMDLFFWEFMVNQLKAIALHTDYLLSGVMQLEIICMLECCIAYQTQINEFLTEITIVDIALMQYLNSTLELRKNFLDAYPFYFSNVLLPCYNNESLGNFLSILNVMRELREDMLIFKSQVYNLALQLREIVETRNTPRLNFH